LREFDSIGEGHRLAAFLVASVFFASIAAAQSIYEDNTVALRVTRQFFDEDRPWAKKNPEVRNGTVVVLSDHLLLTEASMIQNATFIQVEKHGRAGWVPARLVHQDSTINLALLTVDQPGFFDDLTPAEIAASAKTDGVVHSVRWKGKQLEVSNSRPGRIEVIESPYGTVHHAVLKLSTDFSAGGWADPVFADDKLIGITVTQDDGQTATVVPAEIIKAYVDSAARDGGDSGYRGFASIGALHWQTNTDRALTAYLGLEGEPQGIFIRRVPWGSTGCSSLRPHDILMELDGHKIDASGNYDHPLYGQLRFEHIVVEGHAPGDVVSARVFRDRQFIDVEIELRHYPASARLIPWRRADSAPPYLVAGGFVLRELDGRYLNTWGKDWGTKAPNQLRYFYFLRGTDQSPERRRIIVVSDVLPAAYNIGYHGISDLLVKSINGFEIDSIADAEAAFKQPEEDLHRIAFYPNFSVREVILDGPTFEEETQAILSAYEVPDRLRFPDNELPELGPECLNGR
jgi:S1-C subfamily serine protease